MFCQEIISFSLIDLNVADRNLNSFFFHSFLVESVCKSSWNQTTIIKTLSSTSHGECFTRTGLTIRKNSSIVTVYCWVYDIFCDFIENFLLFCIHVEELIECENSFFLLVIDITFISIFCNKEFYFVLLFVEFFS